MNLLEVLGLTSVTNPIPSYSQAYLDVKSYLLHFLGEKHPIVLGHHQLLCWSTGPKTRLLHFELHCNDCRTGSECGRGPFGGNSFCFPLTLRRVYNSGKVTNHCPKRLALLRLYQYFSVTLAPAGSGAE